MKEQGITYEDIARDLSKDGQVIIAADKLKAILWSEHLSLSVLNMILDVFSYEMVPIFRKRWPLTHN